MKMIASNVITGVLVGLGVTQMQDGRFDYLDVNKMHVNKLLVEEVVVKQLNGDDNAFIKIDPRKMVFIAKRDQWK